MNMLMGLGALALVSLAILAIVAQFLPRSFVPPSQQIRMPDGRLLVGPDKVLGNGAFGTVCQYTLANNEPVAVKIPNRPEYNELQQRELKLLQKANPHPNVIKYIAQVEVSNKLWIIMELMKGSVRGLLTKNPGLSIRTKLSIAIQMATGVSYLHQFNSTGWLVKKAIVHQDLKPDNLLVDTLDDNPNLRVKICDFGIARQLDQLKLPGFGTISSKLHRGNVGGTLLYMAPEVVASMCSGSECCTPKSDVFSMGLILWEIATQQRPSRTEKEIMGGTFEEFDRDKNTDRRSITKQRFFGARTVTRSDPTYPQSSFFGAIIGKCIQPKQSERISACETRERLNKISLPF